MSNALKRELKRIRVDEVSVVDSPAIEETFVIVKTVSGATDLPVADRDAEWNGSDAATRIVEASTDAEGNVDWSAVHRAFFYYDPNAAETITGHKLGFADVVDGEIKAIPNGIVAVAGVLQGARGGVDVPEEEIAGIKTKVEGYYKTLGMTPPWKSEDGAGGAEGNMNKSTAPAHDALLQEKIAAVTKVAQDIASSAASLDPKALADKVWALSDLVYGIKDVGTIVSLSKRAVDDKLAAGDAKGAIDALVADLKKATGGGSQMDPTKKAEWEQKAKAAGKVLKLDANGEPVLGEDGNPVMVDAPAGKKGQKRFTRERTEKIANAAKALADVLKEVGVDDLNALASMVKDGKVEEEEDAEVDGVKKAIATIVKPGLQKSTDTVVDDLIKRIQMLESGAASRGLAADGTPIKKASESIFKGVI